MINVNVIQGVRKHKNRYRYIKANRSGAQLSFEAKGQTFRHVVCHSMSSTLMPIFFRQQLMNLLPFPLPAPLTNCLILLKILLFKEILSELQPCLGNWFFGFQKLSCFKNFLREHAPQSPLLACTFSPRKAPYSAKKNLRPVLLDISSLL